MKESVLDVLKFLFENSFDPDCNPTTSLIPDRDALKRELETAGFHATQVESALSWLDALAADTERPACRSGGARHACVRCARVRAARCRLPQLYSVLLSSRHDNRGKGKVATC